MWSRYYLKTDAWHTRIEESCYYVINALFRYFSVGVEKNAL
jgi:hypothetical protein